MKNEMGKKFIKIGNGIIDINHIMTILKYTKIKKRKVVYVIEVLYTKDSNYYNSKIFFDDVNEWIKNFDNAWKILKLGSGKK